MLRAVDDLFVAPLTTPKALARNLGMTYPPANKLVARLVELGVLEEVTGHRRNREFVFRRYMNLFHDGR